MDWRSHPFSYGVRERERFRPHGLEEPSFLLWGEGEGAVRTPWTGGDILSLMSSHLAANVSQRCNRRSPRRLGEEFKGSTRERAMCIRVGTGKFQLASPLAIGR
ncbi:UNVERIFIED_CONTAM: hypothetical protein FKN15_000472 [Acipenser sinensis]